VPQTRLGGIAETRVIAGDDDIGAEHHVGAATNAPALHGSDGGLFRVPELHVGFDEAADHGHVLDRVPHRLLLLPGLRRWDARGPIEGVAGTESRAFGAQEDDMHPRVAVGVVDRFRKVIAQRGDDGVVFARPGEGDDPDAGVGLGRKRGRHAGSLATSAFVVGADPTPALRLDLMTLPAKDT